MTEPKVVDDMIDRAFRVLVDHQNRIDAIRIALIEANVVDAEAIDRHYATLSAASEEAMRTGAYLQQLRDFGGIAH